VDRKSKLEHQRAEMKVKIGRKEEGIGQQGSKEKKGINSEKMDAREKLTQGRKEKGN
jgi:hypothetical protein